MGEHGRNTNNWPGFTLEYRGPTRRLNPGDYELIAGQRRGAGEQAQLKTSGL